MGRIEGKVAIVTGGGSGIGRGICLRLAEEGAKIVVSDIGEEGGKETEKQVRAAGGDAIFIHHDVASEDDWKAVIDETVKTYGQLDILANNAGVFVVKPASDTTLKEFQWQNEVNVDGVFLGIKHGMAAMEKSGGGSIINTSSIAGIVGLAMSPGYCASKGAVRLLTKACALECAQKKNNIRINSVHPGSIKTPIIEKAIVDLGNDESLRAGFEEMSPMGFIGEPLDIANGVLYLASDESKYVTGAELVIDAGITAG